MRRVTRSVAVLLILCLCLSGCAGAVGSGDTAESAQEAQTSLPGGETAEPGLVRLAIQEPVSTMDVHKNSTHYMIPLNIYERLFEIRVREDGSTVLVNGLAEDWSVSEDGCTYRFSLRPDAFFSDGTPVRASDVAFSFTRMLALPNGVQSAFGDMILGAQDVMTGKSDTLEGIRVLDERNLEITLSEPFAGYLYQLATPPCSILSEKCVTEAGPSFGRTAAKTIGSGPYRVTEFTQERITLERNPYYHCREGEELTVERAELLVLAPAMVDRMFREGQLDLLDLDYVSPETVEEVYGTEEWKERMLDTSRVSTRYLMLNVEAQPLDDLRIRKAVQMAINRQQILDELFNGEGNLLDGIYPQGLIGYSEANQGWLQYDPDEAAKLVGEVPGAADVRLELAMNSQADIRILRMMQMIQQDLEAVGLNAVIVSYDEASFLYLRGEGDLIAYIGRWAADFNDPDNFIYTFFGGRDKTRSRSSNYGGEAVMARIAAARSIQDEEERLAEYAELEKILIRDEALWVPLFADDHQFIPGDRVESFTPFWAGWSDLYLKDIVLKEEARS